MPKGNSEDAIGEIITAKQDAAGIFRITATLETLYAHTLRTGIVDG
jgi:hypothetical protein